MARKKKDSFDVVSEVKAVARKRVGQPKPTRILSSAADRAVDRRVRGEKHKPTLSRIKSEQDSE